MCMIVGKFHCVLVENLKPVSWEQLSETCDPDELVYLNGSHVECVVAADVVVGMAPEANERAED